MQAYPRSWSPLPSAPSWSLLYPPCPSPQAAAGFTCYFAVFSKYGILFEDLSGTGFKYIDSSEKFILGLDYDTRINILRQATTHMSTTTPTIAPLMRHDVL